MQKRPSPSRRPNVAIVFEVKPQVSNCSSSIKDKFVRDTKSIIHAYFNVCADRAADIVREAMLLGSSKVMDEHWEIADTRVISAVEFLQLRTDYGAICKFTYSSNTHS